MITYVVVRYMLEINELSKYFHGIQALNKASVIIRKGSIIGLLGPNGAGKTTMIRLLTGIMKPSSGSAIIYGHDITTEQNAVKRITGLLPEDAALYNKLSIFEYIEFIAALYDIEHQDFVNRFMILLDRLDIRELKDRLIDTLSKGQKQKVALIAALIHEPKVLLLDEPMANLDVVAQRVVKKMIREYQTENRIILIATHLLSNIEDICDTIVVIDRGEIKYTGSMHEFAANAPSLEDAYLQFFKVNE